MLRYCNGPPRRKSSSTCISCRDEPFLSRWPVLVLMLVLVGGLQPTPYFPACRMSRDTSLRPISVAVAGPLLHKPRHCLGRADATGRPRCLQLHVRRHTPQVRPFHRPCAPPPELHLALEVAPNWPQVAASAQVPQGVGPLSFEFGSASGLSLVTPLQGIRSGSRMSDPSPGQAPNDFGPTRGCRTKLDNTQLRSLIIKVCAHLHYGQ